MERSCEECAQVFEAIEEEDWYCRQCLDASRDWDELYSAQMMEYEQQHG